MNLLNKVLQMFVNDNPIKNHETVINSGKYFICEIIYEIRLGKYGEKENRKFKQRKRV